MAVTGITITSDPASGDSDITATYNGTTYQQTIYIPPTGKNNIYLDPSNGNFYVFPISNPDSWVFVKAVGSNGG